MSKRLGRDDSIEVCIQILDGVRFSLMLSPAMTVLDIKKMILEHLESPGAKLSDVKLFFEKIALHDDMTVADTKVRKGETFIVMWHDLSSAKLAPAFALETAQGRLGKAKVWLSLFVFLIIFGKLVQWTLAVRGAGQDIWIPEDFDHWVTACDPPQGQRPTKGWATCAISLLWTPTFLCHLGEVMGKKAVGMIAAEDKEVFIRAGFFVLKNSGRRSMGKDEFVKVMREVFGKDFLGLGDEDVDNEGSGHGDELFTDQLVEWAKVNPNQADQLVNAMKSKMSSTEGWFVEALCSDKALFHEEVKLAVETARWVLLALMVMLVLMESCCACCALRCCGCCLYFFIFQVLLISALYALELYARLAHPEPWLAESTSLQWYIGNIALLVGYLLAVTLSIVTLRARCSVSRSRRGFEEWERELLEETVCEQGLLDKEEGEMRALQDSLARQRKAKNDQLKKLRDQKAALDGERRKLQKSADAAEDSAQSWKRATEARLNAMSDEADRKELAMAKLREEIAKNEDKLRQVDLLAAKRAEQSRRPQKGRRGNGRDDRRGGRPRWEAYSDQEYSTDSQGYDYGPRWR